VRPFFQCTEDGWNLKAIGEKESLPGAAHRLVIEGRLCSMLGAQGRSAPDERRVLR
jgi:hypothetical protein